MIGIVEYEMGNIQSVLNAFGHLGVQTTVVRNPEEMSMVDKIVLPGVGAFGEGMEKLKCRGLIEPLHTEVLEKGKPFLGICLGMQLICKESFEFGHFLGLGWVDASVRRLETNSNLRVPHVGWNNLRIKRPNRLIDSDISYENLDVYFVHSYYVDSLHSDYVIATCDYGIEFVAAIEKGNIFATQFHPEKSQFIGLGVLQNFSKA